MIHEDVNNEDIHKKDAYNKFQLTNYCKKLQTVLEQSRRPSP